MKKIILGFLVFLFFSGLQIAYAVSTPPLDGTFIYTEYIPAAEVNSVLTEIAGLNMNTIIVAWSRVKTGNCSSNTYQWGTGMPDKIQNILNEADALNLQVYIGLTSSGDACDWYADATNSIQDAADDKYAVSTILNLGNHPSLKGWYIPIEPGVAGGYNNYALDAIYAYFQTVTSAIKQVSSLPTVVAPPLIGSANKDPQVVAQNALDLKNRGGVTIQAWQDSLGSSVPLGWQRPPANPTYQVSDYFNAISQKIGANSFWSDIELFTCASPVSQPWSSGCALDWDLYRPAPMSRIANQLVQSNIAAKKVSWIQQTMMGVANSNAHMSEAPRLYDSYRAYFGLKNKYLIPVSYQWITTPSSNYPDTGNKLFDGQTGDPRNFMNTNWVGIVGNAKMKLTFNNPEQFFWVGIHVLDSSPQGITFPDSYTLECSNDDITYTSLGTWPFPYTKKDADYLFANPSSLNATCKYLKITLSNTQWTFLSEVEIVGNDAPSTPTPIPICIPNCTNKACGNDGCGNSCGSCDVGQSCINYQCVVPTLTPTRTPTPVPPTPTRTPTPTPIPGDISGPNGKPDGKVDIQDYNQLVTDFGKTGTPGWIAADINKDGKVDIFDYNVLVGNFGK